MQEQNHNGEWGPPEILDVMRMVDRLPSVRRLAVFAAYDDEGRPTPELRRAWRRHRGKK
jgi:hypothetical protein